MYAEVKKALRAQWTEYGEQRTADKPSLVQIQKQINEGNQSIMNSWAEVKNDFDTIHAQRKEQFEKRGKFDAKEANLRELMQRLDTDSYIMTVPGKLPESYQKTIEELERRKSLNLAIEKVCLLLQRAIRSERK